jgi:hypothetical protein
MANRLSKVLGSLIAASGRFPLVVLAGLAGLASALVLNHVSGHKDLANESTRLMLAAIALLPLGVAAGLVGEMHRRFRWLAVVAVLVLAAGIWMALPAAMETSAHAYRYAAFLLGAAALASAVPGVEGNAAWWRTNVAMIQAVVLAGILSGIVELGLQLAVFSVEKLFDLDFDKLHLDLFSFVAFIVAPLAVITLLPSGAEQPGGASVAASAFWEGLCKWVLVPLGFIFTAILAVYSVSIFVQQELPDGMVAMPVLSLGAYGTAAMLLLQPWRDGRAWARWFSRIYPSAFLVFSVLLFLAIAERISAYGVTFARYSALASGLWFAAAAVIFLLRTGKGSLLIAGLFALGAAVAALGPASAATLSLHSQSERLRGLLQSPIADADKPQIRDGLKYLASNFGLAAIEDVTGPLGLDADKRRPWQLAGEVMKKLGLDEDGGAIKFEWQRDRPLSTEGYRFVHVPPRNGGGECELGKAADGKPLAVKLRAGELAVFAGDEKVRELLPAAMLGMKSDTNAAEPLRVPFEIGQRQFCLFVLRAEIGSDPESRGAWSKLEYLVFER